MTKEEAIKELKILKEEYWDDDGYGHETEQYDDTMLALDMAMKALEQEPVYFPPCVDCNAKMNEIREVHDKLKPYKVKRAFEMGWDGKKKKALMGGRCECGQYISDTDKYCRKCGKPLDWGAIFGESEGKAEMEGKQIGTNTRG